MVRTYLGAASFKGSIAKLKEQILKLQIQNNAVASVRDLEKPKSMPMMRQLSTYTVGDCATGRTELIRKVEEILRDDVKEIKGVCFHGKTTVALHVHNELNRATQKRFTCSRVELPLEIKMVDLEKELPLLQRKILIDINKDSPNSIADGRVADCNISNALDGKEHLRRAFEKSGSPILLFIDNVQLQEHLLKFLPNVEHFPRGSRLLVTARNEKICKWFSLLGVKDGLCHSIPVETLGMEESRVILRKWALIKMEKHQQQQEIMNEDYLRDWEDEVLHLCGGLPLALKVVGSYIACSNKGAASADTWRHVVKTMKEGRPVDGDKNNELYARLRISIDALDDVLKRDFFDLVACYLPERCSKLGLEPILGEEELQNLGIRSGRRCGRRYVCMSRCHSISRATHDKSR